MRVRLAGMPDSLVIDPRFRGFDKVAQGGYTSGLLARRLGGPARVKLRGPVPMGEPLLVEADGERIQLRGESGVLAEAEQAELALEVPEQVSPERAAAVASAYPGHHAHPYPECFCCGPAREPDDGLRIFPAPLAEGSDLLAALWEPGDGLGEDGLLPPEIIWAAFDCPQLWALMLSSPPDSTDHVVTASLETEIRRPVPAAGRYAIASWPMGVEGRRHYAGGALFDAAGELLAVSRQTAVTAPAGVPLGRSWQ